MGLAFPRLRGLELPEAQRRAIKMPLVGLRAALDGERYEAAVRRSQRAGRGGNQAGAGESGVEPAARASVASLAKLALATRSGNFSDEDLASRLSGVVETLGNLGMEVGTGHGRVEQDAVDAEIAWLAASAACGVARFVLSSTA
jgi:hypothetical protein